MKKFSLTQIITLLATIVTITINGLANTLPLNGLTTGEISDRFEIFFVPAGYVFSIWGLIYLGLIIYSIYQILPSRREDGMLNRIAPFYWAASLANTIWIFLWHYEVFPITLIAMLVLLASLLFIYLQVKNNSGASKWFVKLPFSVYLGWITVATVANVSQFLYFFNWDGWGIAGSTWAIIMIAVASLIGLLMAWRETDAPYVLVLIWAFIGITVSQMETYSVVIAAWTAVIVLAVGILVSTIKNKKIY